MENLRSLIKDSKLAKQKDDSKERLRKIASTKIKTTMIGALEVVEKYFGSLWKDDPDSEEAKYFKEIWDKIRQEILDKGNTQIRNLESELLQYKIEWTRYQLTLPVIPRGKGE